MKLQGQFTVPIMAHLSVSLLPSGKPMKRLHTFGCLKVKVMQFSCSSCEGWVLKQQRI